MKKDIQIMKELGKAMEWFGDRAAKPAKGVRDDVALSYYVAAACLYGTGGKALQAELDAILDLASLLLVPQLGEPTRLTAADLGSADDAYETFDLCRAIAEVLEVLPREEQIYGSLRDFLADDGLLVLPLLKRLAEQYFAVEPPPVVTLMLTRLELTFWSLAAIAGCAPNPALDGRLAFGPDEEVEEALKEKVEALRTWTGISEEDRRAFEEEFGLDDDEDLGRP